jgi:uncharacterized membrane protein
MDRNTFIESIMAQLRARRGLASWWPVAVIAGLLLAGAYYVRPWFHGIVIGLYKYPLVLFLLFALVVLVVAQIALLIRADDMRNKDTGKHQRAVRTRRVLGTTMVALIICIIPLLMYSSYYMDRALYENTDYTLLEGMPETEIFRFLPLSVASRYSLDAFTDPQFTLGDGDLVEEDGRLYWKFPIVPDGTLLYYTKKPQGVISIAADMSGKEVTTSLQDMEIGENIGITDNITWQIYKQDMFCDIADIYYQDDMIIVSVIKYKFKLLGRYPYFGGVYTIDYDGTITHYSPDEAAQQPWGTRIYPESLARKQVEVVNTKNGLLNMWIYHKEMIEIQDVYSGGNRQPYLIDTTEGLMWMTAVEPRGRSFGLYEIYFQDAATGQMYTYRISNANLTGPRYSVDYVKKTFPNFDWFSFYISEPRPVIKDGELYWLVSIVPNDSAGVTRQCVVNARTSDVTAFESDADVKAFFAGAVVPGEDEGPSIEDVQEKIAEIEAILASLKELLAELAEEET